MKMVFVILILILLPYNTSVSHDIYDPPTQWDVELRGAAVINLTQDTSTDLNFINMNSLLSGSFGIAVEWIPVWYFSIETGFHYRYYNYGEVLSKEELFYSEIQIPLILYFRIPLTYWLTVQFGGGGSYFKVLSGNVNIIDSVNTSYGQTKINLSDSDLRSGFSYIIKSKVKFFMNHHLYFFMDIAGEYGKHTLDLKQWDLQLGGGIGFNFF